MLVAGRTLEEAKALVDRGFASRHEYLSQRERRVEDDQPSDGPVAVPAEIATLQGRQATLPTDCEEIARLAGATIVRCAGQLFFIGLRETSLPLTPLRGESLDIHCLSAVLLAGRRRAVELPPGGARG